MAIAVKGNPKASFSIATTSRCKGGWYSFPWIAPLDTYFIMLSFKQRGIKYHYWVFGMTRPEIEPLSPGPLANSGLFVILTNVKFNFNIFFRIMHLTAKGDRFYNRVHCMNSKYSCKLVSRLIYIYIYI